MSYYLFLDDQRHPSRVNWIILPQNVAWTIARSYEEFVDTIRKQGLPKFVTYDCDLCQEHYNAFFSLKEKYVLQYHEFQKKCGIHCVEHLLKLCKRQKVPHPEFLAHTLNHYAKEFIERMIQEYNATYE